jgi:hypothetical protein
MHSRMAACVTRYTVEKVGILGKSTEGGDFVRYRLRETSDVPGDGAFVPCFSLG